MIKRRESLHPGRISSGVVAKTEGWRCKDAPPTNDQCRQGSEGPQEEGNSRRGGKVNDPEESGLQPAN